VAAEDDREGPDVAHQVGGDVAGDDDRRDGAGQEREQQVVLLGLRAGLARIAARRLGVVHRLVAARQALDLELVQRDAVLEEQQRAARVDGLPRSRVPRLLSLMRSSP
jgi:hypothetical protein